ncbi:hypothetical protein B5V88_07100 [Heyndrickxia sporothermodurans]|uniref:Uncharacterized protein n=1 Tax=Heyndrickxia sporothermodurans TaxID=46224 RepID=A0AB37HPF9_9BACI|nr:hypothetical protein [Heyndrickxia sporothermodurans]MBL5767360.1 hypothetical protein [Heyndrickxia sporothermodurans]MBL5770833.1 hypothetical protein [Heyndrickxia sporothermodurans]MBL5774473.1 hypothetical protein [Heyndrickxia sporothermodurans]MBL5779563.1 hypothetical protein [Heyndrickxia sporothermodurans]MBL5781560.1 hypothetical protein [Heyndrickxia sporothermodurans]
MNIKKDIVKRESPDIWKWAGTRISSLICSETLIDEFIECEKQKIEKAERDLLDIHVFNYEDGGYPMVNIDFLTRPKQNINMRGN